MSHLKFFWENTLNIVVWEVYSAITGMSISELAVTERHNMWLVFQKDVLAGTCVKYSKALRNPKQTSAANDCLSFVKSVWKQAKNEPYRKNVLLQTGTMQWMIDLIRSAETHASWRQEIRCRQYKGFHTYFNGFIEVLEKANVGLGGKLFSSGVTIFCSH